MPDTQQEAPERRPFSAWLTEQRRGSLHSELSEALAELGRACLEHQGAGEVTLKIKAKPNKDGVSLTVTDDVKCKIPQPDRGAAIFFADDRGNLTRNDPRQQELGLREVRGGKQEQRDQKETA